jgi:predicted dehydrogenase
MGAIKQEPSNVDFDKLDDYTSFQQPEAELPVGFERNEWDALTEVIITAAYHSIYWFRQGWQSEEAEINYILSQRGQGGSKKGRPTNYHAPYKGPLSATARAVAQRNRNATLSAEERAKKAAGDADRGAKSALKKRVEKAKIADNKAYILVIDV